MSLTLLNPPEAAVAALRSALAAHLVRTALADEARSLTDEFALQAPVFIIDQVDRLSIDGLNGLRPAAWRFVLSYRGTPSIIGDVTTADDSYALTMVRNSEAEAGRLMTVAFRSALHVCNFEDRDA